MSTPILLDCDPGHDDAIALLLALGSEELQLRGVTTVAGNQTLEKTTANAIRVLELVDRGDVPVAAGADRPLVREPRVAANVHGETGLDGPDLPPPQGRPSPQHAVDFLAERLDGATLVATGPLTNVALLLARHPNARPERIVLMGGAIAEGNVTPAAEFNIWADPEAAARVFTSGIDVTMVGLDVSPVHDAVAVAHLIDSTLLETAHVNVQVDCESRLCRGRTVVDLWRRTGLEANAHVATGIDVERFLALFHERLAGLG